MQRITVQYLISSLIVFQEISFYTFELIFISILNLDLQAWLTEKASKINISCA